MTVLIRVGRVLAILVLAVIAVSLAMALGSGDTGLLEKVVLVLLIAGCVYAAAQVTTLATRLQERLLHR